MPPSLPLGGERTALVRSGPSGSASGTFVVEWQCVSHCHSVVSVLSGAPYTATRHRAYRIGTIRAEWQCVRYDQGRVAVQLTLPLGGERAGQCVSHCHSVVSVPDSAPYTATRHRACRIGTIRAEWQCLLAGTDSGAAAVTPIGEWPNWANALGQPPAKPQGRSRRGLRASAWGLTARKGAVWTEGLADGAP